jgi:methionyl-tRNA synthetase
MPAKSHVSHRTDEHGQKIEEKAKQPRDSPASLLTNRRRARGASLILEADEHLHRQIHTAHRRLSRKTIRALQKDVDNGTYTRRIQGLYFTPCESFWTETQLLDANAPTAAGGPALRGGGVIFLRLSKYTDRIISSLRSNPILEPQSRHERDDEQLLKARS